MNLVVLGRQPELSLAELVSLFGSAARPYGEETALVDAAVELSRLGGSVKCAEVVASFEQPPDMDKLAAQLATMPELLDRLGSGKTAVGLSLYGLGISPRGAFATSLELKRQLRQAGRSVRVVPADGTAVSAASIIHNQPLDIVVAAGSSGYVVALTAAVQDIDAYSLRDYGRPGRSAKLGMLPPKLAQIMINLAHPPAGGRLLDPFCGTGVVPMEALLMGYGAVGADIEPEALKLAQSNLSWLAQEQAPGGSWELEAADARRLRLDRPADALVSEGYLGPALTKPPTGEELKRLTADAAKLTVESLDNLRHSLKPGAGVCICLPAWRLDKGFARLDIVDQILALGYTLKRFEPVRSDLIYARPGQIVARELLTLTRE